ncbi:MAG TPA: GNAT family N-acetyltransferase [Pelagibacterium sp.]|uniref:GNAT family N-acetyltransferase n=1 Tax=Pelagibacterium sp. TaxID=1967288 RepID=UPI002C037B47|nr:GNAT family N-acetyltransferase [Pelagibacterium sp.]HWJ89309.1 GNAT family N-acetyltransferase [Pelagibacterium sp.]
MANPTSQPELTLMVVPAFSPVCNLGFALRREVFVLEQGVPEDIEHDADDLTATHIVGLAEGAVIAVARVAFKPDYAKIGRVAVARSHRGRAIGARLIAFAVEVAREQGQKQCYLESQIDKIDFYSRLGFVAFGEEFLDAGIVHRKMKNY